MQDAIHFGPNGELRPPYAAYSGPVRHPFNASEQWNPWMGEAEATTGADAPADPMFAALMDKANDPRYSNEAIGNAFRAAFSDLGPEWHDRLAGADAPPPLDPDLLFESLAFLGEDDILADGSLWKVKEIAYNAAAEYARLRAEQEGEGRERPRTPGAAPDGRNGPVQSPEGTSCGCPGPAAGYHFAHLPDCPRREARPFA